jgi:hypothetical protein
MKLGAGELSFKVSIPGAKDQRCGFLTMQVKATHSHIIQQIKITGEALQSFAGRAGQVSVVQFQFK